MSKIIKKGSRLVAKNNFYMNTSSNEQFLTKNKIYIIKNISFSEFKIIDDNDDNHYFDINTYEEFFTLFEMKFEYDTAQFKWLSNSYKDVWVAEKKELNNKISTTVTHKSLYYVTKYIFPNLLSDNIHKKYSRNNDSNDLYMISLWKKRLNIVKKINKFLFLCNKLNFNDTYNLGKTTLIEFSNRCLDKGLTLNEIKFFNEVYTNLIKEN